MSHPDTTELLDHLEGRVSLADHLAGCVACREVASDLGAALAVEERAFARPGELETERALAAVMGRAHARGRRRWGATLGFMAAAAALLAFAIPSVPADHATGPVGGPSNTGVFMSPAKDVPAPDAVAEQVVTALGSNVSVIGSSQQLGR